MVSKKAIIGIAVVVIVVIVIAAVAAGGGSSDEEQDADVRYDYAAELSDGWDLDQIIPTKPSDGMQFVVIHYVLANDAVTDGITTNPLIFEWTATVNGLTYDLDMIATASHPDERTVGINVGAQAESVAVIEVPAGVSLDDIEIALEYSFDDLTLERDDSLL